MNARTRPLPEDAVRFRSGLLDILLRDQPPERFAYIDSDTSVCVCPVCDGALVVRFAGHAPRADIECQRGCADEDVREAIGARRARR